MELKSTLENKAAFDNFYEVKSRLKYPNLIFIHYFMRYIKHEKSIKNALSIGCGDGANEFAVAREGIRVKCIDISELAVKRVNNWAREEALDVTAELGNQADLSSFKDQSFDFVICWQVLSYGTSEVCQKALDEIYRVLRKGGYLIATLESKFHTGYTQNGVTKIGENTYRLPNEVKVLVPNVVASFYSEDDVRNMTKKFSELYLALEILHPPNNLDQKVGQWMFLCRK
ncbi:MAG: class I SAM-dependent methyltransferase [Candidatus Omnitrophica bacterium]|nr:class I SAM-dependent methyltransferase [Candidatus Omnitrophota bacterium]